ncbi:MAG: hypothetical protein WCI56_05330 [Hyphomicrobiales bacterium]
MGRLVRIPTQANQDLTLVGLEGVLPHGLGPKAPAPDNYLERMAKYVPAEVLAFSLFINGILGQAVKTGGSAASMAGVPVTTIAMLALIAGMIVTPLFMWYVREEGDAWLTNAIVSTLLFPVWAYAMGAVAFADIHDGNLAAILLASVTVGSGLVSPPVKREKRRERAASPGERPQLVEVTGSQFSA